MLTDVNPKQQRLEAAEAEAYVDSVSELVNRNSQKSASAHQIAVLPVGAEKVGKSTALSAYIEQDDDHVLQHKLIDSGKTGDTTDAAAINVAVSQAATALYTELGTKVEHLFHTDNGRYSLHTILSSQAVGATTTSALRVEHCGSNVPSVTVTYKSAEVLDAIDHAHDIVQQCEMVTTDENMENQQVLQQAIHLLGKGILDVTESRAELGVPTTTTGTANDVNDNSDTDDDVDSDVSDNDATDTGKTVKTTVFKPLTKFNKAVDYTLPASTRPLISQLLGKTVKTDIRAKNAEELIAVIAKLLVMLSAPAFSVCALFGLVESIVVRLPSSTLYDSKSGLSTTIYDVPGVLGSDVVRRPCCVDTLRNQLNNSDHAVILLVVENRVTTDEVYDGLADAGVFMRLLTDPASLCILLVFVCDKDNKRMPDALIAAVKRMQVDSFRQQLDERAAALQQANSLTEREKSKRLKAAKRSINFITVETHPEKISAH
eukprot:6725-Heterococcus_DN1.PRE.1